MGWDGMGWDRTGWDGMGWDRIGLDGDGWGGREMPAPVWRATQRLSIGSPLLCLWPLAAPCCRPQGASNTRRPCNCLPRPIHEQAVKHLCADVEMDPFELHLTRDVGLEEKVVSKPDEEHEDKGAVQRRRAASLAVQGGIVLRPRRHRRKSRELGDDLRPIKLPQLDLSCQRAVSLRCAQPLLQLAIHIICRLLPLHPLLREPRIQLLLVPHGHEQVSSEPAAPLLEAQRAKEESRPQPRAAVPLEALNLSFLQKSSCPLLYLAPLAILGEGGMVSVVSSK